MSVSQEVINNGQLHLDLLDWFLSFFGETSWLSNFMAARLCVDFFMSCTFRRNISRRKMKAKNSSLYHVIFAIIGQISDFSALFITCKLELVTQRSVVIIAFPVIGCVSAVITFFTIKTIVVLHSGFILFNFLYLNRKSIWSLINSSCYCYRCASEKNRLFKLRCWYIRAITGRVFCYCVAVEDSQDWNSFLWLAGLIDSKKK